MATFFVKTVANKAFEYVKKYLIEELKTKLKEGIDPLFVQITTTLKGNDGLQTILKPICTFKQIDDVKNELIKQTQKDEFYVDLKEKIPEITDDMIVKLKEKLKTLIDEVITCNAPTTTVVEPTATTGCSKQRDRKQKRRQKTKKRIYKKSRGRRQYSRK